MNAVSITCVVGKQIYPSIPDLARLRIEVFQAFLYLYDGDMDYEEKYLRNYARSLESLFVIARHADQIFGVATGVPLMDETGEIQRPFVEYRINPASIFYFGESILLRAYRGRRIGHRFIMERERYALSLGRFSHLAFCAIYRPDDHPLFVPSRALPRAVQYDKGYIIG